MKSRAFPIEGPVLVFVLALLCHDLLFRPLSGDEAFTFLMEVKGVSQIFIPEGVFPASYIYGLLGERGNLKEIYEAMLPHSTNAPLFFYAVYIVKLLPGDAVLAGRLVSTLAFLIQLVFLYKIARKFELSASITISLYSLSIFIVQYAGVARPYALTLAFLLMTVWLCIRIQDAAATNRHASRALAFGAGLGAGLTFATFYLSLFQLAWLMIWLVATVRRPTEPVIAAFAFMLIAVPIGVAASGQLANSQGTPSDPFDPLWSPFLFIYSSAQTVIGRPIYYLSNTRNAIVNLALFAPLVALVCLSLFTRTRGGIDRSFWLLVSGGVAASVVCMYGVGWATGQALTGARHFLPATPFIVLIIARTAAVELRSGSRALPVLTGMMIAVLIARHIELRLNPVYEDRYTQIAAAVAADHVAGENPVLVLGQRFLAANNIGSIAHRLPVEIPIRVVAGDESRQVLEADLAEYNRIWLVVHPIRPDTETDAALVEHFALSDRWKLERMFEHAWVYARRGG